MSERDIKCTNCANKRGEVCKTWKVKAEETPEDTVLKTVLLQGVTTPLQKPRIIVECYIPINSIGQRSRGRQRIS